MPPAKLGLVYSHTGLRRFLDVIGAARTRELFLLGRHVQAPDALTWGLVNAVVPERELEDDALDWAVELAGNAPLSVAGNKQILRALLAGRRAGWTRRVEEELVALRRACFASEDFREGVRGLRGEARRRAGGAADGVRPSRSPERGKRPHRDPSSRIVRRPWTAARSSGRRANATGSPSGRLAVRAQTSQGYISQVERGEVSPSVEAVGRLLACLGERGRIESSPGARAARPRGRGRAGAAARVAAGRPGRA